MAARPLGTYEPVRVRVTREPVPMMRYEERALVDTWSAIGRLDDVVLFLLGWDEGPLRWGLFRGNSANPGEAPAVRQSSAREAMIDLIRDPRAADQQEVLAELLRMPTWQVALGALDDNLSRLEGPAGAGGTTPVARGGAQAERVGFRVTFVAAGLLNVEPVIQKRARGGGFSKGSRFPWYGLMDRPGLSPVDQRAFRAYNDPFARRSSTWSGPLTNAQTFGVLSALVDHPAVFFDDSGVIGGRRASDRLDIRQGRLRLRFSSAPDAQLVPQFELVGVTLLPAEVAESLRDDRHLVYLHRPEDGAPQVLLAQISAQAAALVRALALAPTRFPPEAHDALATRLESLQESIDVELPSQWTRTIGAADGRLIARLELLASGAVELRLAVRPVKLGPVFAPGEGASLLLEGQGRERHGARRDKPEERLAGRALAEKLGLDGGGESEPWCWRVGEGDPALHLVATLSELAGGNQPSVTVEWADGDGLRDLGSVGRRDMRMKVADRHDWFAVEGGAEVKRRGGTKRGGAGTEVVPLAELLAAIREGRRYVPVGTRGFVRIEETLRAALAHAEAAMFEVRTVLQIPGVASDPLMGLVESEAQIEASVAFLALRRRIAEGAGATPRFSPALEATLRPYQRDGAVWLARLAHWGAGAILADEMGLGKTLQTLAVLEQRAARGPALVVAPTSVVGNWVAEAARFTPALAVRLYRGAERAACLRSLGPGDLLITSYAIATMDAEALQPIAFASLVLDEAQAIKNATTERARALRDLRADWRVGLSGTPIENHLGEIWSLMRVLSPGLLGSWEQFRARYAIPIEKFGDDHRRRALAGLLRPFVLRRTKAEVARELPARTEIVRSIRLSPDEQALYEQLRLATLEELARAKSEPDRDAQGMRFVLLAALTRLRQLCCHPRLVYPRTQAGSAKAAYLLELLTELRAGGHKVLVFSQFRSFLDILAPRLRQHGFRVLVLDGTTPAETREERIAAFQGGAADVFLISLKAGGFGLNLTAADTVIHLDPWWNPAVEDQATARAHRIGQQRPVTAVRLVARGTIEEAVLGLHAAKRALASSVLEGTDLAASLGTDELIALIRSSGTAARSG
jgi:superfamily II DNA or RNA helicase